MYLRMCVLIKFSVSLRIEYVEMKRKIHAPDSKPIVASTGVPKNPYTRGNKPFNAWADQFIGDHGIPKVPGGARVEDGKKRKAGPDGDETREVLFDGVRFTAKKVGEEVTIVDEENVGLGEGGWATKKVLRMVIGVKVGSEAATEQGEEFQFNTLKAAIVPILKPIFVSILPESRNIAGLPSGMAVDAPSSDFTARPSAPPAIGSAASAVSKGPQTYPAKGQVSFKESVTDEILAKIQSDVGTFEGRPIQWIRATGMFY